MIVSPQDKAWEQPSMEGEGDQQSKKAAGTGRMQGMLLLVVQLCFLAVWLSLATPQV